MRRPFSEPTRKAAPVVRTDRRPAARFCAGVRIPIPAWSAAVKQIVRWRGDFRRLSTNSAIPGDSDLLSILTYSSFAISRIELTPISSKMRLQPR